MIHKTTPDFWRRYQALSTEIQELARKQFQVLRTNPFHPSLRLKRVQNAWSARVSRDYRAVGMDISGGILWVWIGPHDEYMALLKFKQQS